eukprot:comp72771_c0_seq1/m.48175 comp72771_c0_seq1/g.48175  ORF comp72771_c0_seq1/g.48175 comp72771_c0_seq1/m.48175 type:complete len:348 (-) comp72771_c0_seq1:184-1227(-)
MLASSAALLGPAFQVFGGCCTQALAMETVISFRPSAGMFVTFSQFLFTSCITMTQWVANGCPRPIIPLYHYAAMVLMFFCSSALANVALGYQVSLPLQMIFRSGSLVTNMLMGMVLLRRRYMVSKYVSVLAVSLGILMFTVASMKEKQPTGKLTSTSSAINPLDQTIGVAMLLFSLILASSLGIYQEKVYEKYGRHSSEGIMFTHVLALPIFGLFWQSIVSEVSAFTSSNQITVPLPFMEGGIGVPVMILWMVFSLLTQHWCISSVFCLTTITTSLNVTLVLTLRKFISLVLSVILFNNRFNLMHAGGAALVFGGTLLYVDAHKHMKGALSANQKQETANGTAKKDQ